MLRLLSQLLYFKSCLKLRDSCLEPDALELGSSCGALGCALSFGDCGVGFGLSEGELGRGGRCTSAAWLGTSTACLRLQMWVRRWLLRAPRRLRGRVRLLGVRAVASCDALNVVLLRSGGEQLLPCSWSVRVKLLHWGAIGWVAVEWRIEWLLLLHKCLGRRLMRRLRLAEVGRAICRCVLLLLEPCRAMVLEGVLRGSVLLLQRAVWLMNGGPGLATATMLVVWNV